MKHRFSLSFTLSVVCLVAMPAVNALAQDQYSQDLKSKLVEMEALQYDLARIRAEMLRYVGEKISFETKVVKGAPYSATVEAETVETLADGNRIRFKSTTHVYRDSGGRTRREVVEKEQNAATEIFISDPASGVNYILYPHRRSASKSQVNLQELELDKMKLLYDLEMKTQKMNPPPPGSRVDVRPEDEELVKKKRGPVTESLGQQIIEGVMCEGKRATSTIPAGAVGNDLPINIVNEQWHSPELQVFVLTKQSDPRFGETIYRLTNITRSEPDRALFEVPADYSVKETSPFPAKKKKRPPQEQ
jgi:hypothetical protein